MPVDIQKLVEFKQKYLESPGTGEPLLGRLTEWCLVSIVEMLANINSAAQQISRR